MKPVGTYVIASLICTALSGGAYAQGAGGGNGGGGGAAGGSAGQGGTGVGTPNAGNTTGSASGSKGTSTMKHKSHTIKSQSRPASDAGAALAVSPILRCGYLWASRWTAAPARCRP
ncbi:hypothetical protein BZM27_34525 [Paraburkholderia steynii]|uniref:Uncharacterized protein n=1 Tax=Paraburkholderia steynii TaxID=1245441 RepID=A0A4R0XCA1_9BURK|nr:hypothetical protein BZM27_34525 [Paraburkholderia steynii]